MKKIFTFILMLSFTITSLNSMAQCTTASYNYGDLNNAGGAPCGPGGITNPDFTGDSIGVYGSEAYTLDNVQAGYSYVFDMCSGVGAGAWIPAITIVTPTGTIDAFKLGTTGTFATNCSVNWTATQSGTYKIVIHQAGVACGTATNIDNGNPTVLVGANPAPCGATSSCSSGNIAAALSGTIQNLCPGDSIILGTDGTEVILAGEVYGWYFQSNTMVDSVYFVTGVTSFYGDLNATLVSLGSNPIPYDSYTVFGFTTSSGGTSFCSDNGTLDEFTVNFLAPSNPACGASTGGCNTGDVSPSLVGTTQNLCVGDSIVLYTNGLEVVLPGETYGWFFQSNTMPDSSYIVTGPTSYYGDLNAALGTDAIPYDSYTVYGFVTDSAQTVLCGGDVTVNGFTVNFLAPGSPLCLSAAACTTAANVYTNLNTAGGAPCNDGTGCTPTDAGFVGFGIYGSEAYLLNGVQAGFDYVFDMCNGFGAGSWIPAITIVSPSGAIDAFNLGATGNFAANCSLPWTATESGVYTIVIHEAGVACGTETAIDNGNPTVYCGTNAATCLPCIAGTLVSSATMTICENTTDSIVLSGESTPGSYSISFAPGAGATGGMLAGFTIEGITSFPWEMDNDLMGILSSNSLPVLGGIWTLTILNIDANDDICAQVTPSISVNFLEATNVLCSATPCAISAITAGAQTACVPATNNYTQTVTVTYTNAPTTGTLIVNGQSFAITSSPQTVTLVGLVSNGNPVNVTAAFSAIPSCVLTSNALFTAPASCLCPTISVATTSTNVTNCTTPNGSATATATGGTAPYTYVWTPAGSGATISNLSSGTYTVTATDFNGCTGTSSVTVANASGFTALVDNFFNVSCFGGNNGAITITTTGAIGSTTYNWSDQGFASSTASRSDLVAGSYTVVVTNNGCPVTVGPIVITQPNALVATVDNSSDITCNGLTNGSINVTVAGGNGGNTYLWSNGGGSNEDASGLSAGSYVLTVTDNKACVATTSSVTITEPAVIAIALDSKNDVTCFGGNNGSVLVTATGGTGALTYSWSNGGGSSEDVLNATAGTYTLTVTDTKGCSASSAQYTIAQPTQIVIAIDEVEDVSCLNANDGSITATVTGGTGAYTNVWTNGAGTSLTPSSLAPNTYQLTVTDASGCSATSSVVTIGEPTALTATISSTKTNPGLNTGTATVVAAGGTAPYTYKWDDAAVQTTSAATGLTAGPYVCTITDAKGCSMTISTEVGVTNAITSLALQNLSIYPNPSNGKFTVLFETTETMNLNVKVFSTIGKVVYSNKYSNVSGVFNKQYDFNHLSNGVYFIEFENDNAKTINRITISK